MKVERKSMETGDFTNTRKGHHPVSHIGFGKLFWKFITSGSPYKLNEGPLFGQNGTLRFFLSSLGRNLMTTNHLKPAKLQSEPILIPGNQTCQRTDRRPRGKASTNEGQAQVHGNWRLFPHKEGLPPSESHSICQVFLKSCPGPALDTFHHQPLCSSGVTLWACTKSLFCTMRTSQIILKQTEGALQRIQGRYENALMKAFKK